MTGRNENFLALIRIPDTSLFSMQNACLSVKQGFLLIRILKKYVYLL
jgi:hypothetical protein